MFHVRHIYNPKTWKAQSKKSKNHKENDKSYKLSIYLAICNNTEDSHVK